MNIDCPSDDRLLYRTTKVTFVTKTLHAHSKPKVLILVVTIIVQWKQTAICNHGFSVDIQTTYKSRKLIENRKQSRFLYQIGDSSQDIRSMANMNERGGNQIAHW